MGSDRSPSPGAWHARFSRIGLGKVAAGIAGVCVAAILFAACRDGDGGAATLRFHPERPAVAYISTQICQLIGPGGGGARIRGQDGGTSNVVGGRGYWTFGDTLTDDPSDFVWNNVAVSTDFEADDCIDMTYKRDGDGFAAPLLPTEPGEVTVWAAAGQAAIDEHTVYFLYNSVSSADIATGAFHFRGIGLGKFDTANLAGQRVIEFLITDEDLRGASLSLSPAVDMLVHDGFLYVYFAVGFNARVGRVPVARIEDKAAYRYWDGQGWVADVSRSIDILQTRGGQQAFNVDWDPYLGKWTAAYSTDTLSAPAMAYADAPQGPFVDETILFDCTSLFPATPPPGTKLVYPEYNDRYFCYHLTQHPELDKNDRQTIYLTYANLGTYRLYLHKIVLGVPFVQWDDAQGRAVYARQGTEVIGGMRRGVAFYVPTLPGDGLAPIHDWLETSTGPHLYEAERPGDGFDERGVAFYASTQPAEGLAPVYRWQRKGDPSKTIYSTFDLGPLGYRKAATSFYAKTLDDQQAFDASGGYVYRVHATGDTDFGCCGTSGNPTAQTSKTEQEFVLSVAPDPRGYEAEVCSPVCGTGGRVVWSGPVTFSPNAQGGKLRLTPNGPK